MKKSILFIAGILLYMMLISILADILAANQLITPSKHLKHNIITTLKPCGVQVNHYSLMNIFNQLKVYAAKWQVSSKRSFTKEEIEVVKEAEVVPSEYGSSVMFTLISGGTTYIPLSTNSTVGVGEKVDLKKATLLTLSREGSSDIIRVEV